MSDVAITELQALLTAIKGYDDPRRATSEWKRIYALLQKTGLASGRFQAIVGMRDVAALEALIGELLDGIVSTDEGPDAETCRRALRAFRKRAKLTRLDDESKLGKGPLSKGGDERLGAITPPVEFPDTVWSALVRQGKLRYLGDGLYELDAAADA